MPDGLSYEITSNGHSLIRSRKMLRPLPNFVHFPSPLLPTPKHLQWDPLHLPNNHPSTRTGSRTETNSGTSINLLEQPGSNSTGPHSVAELPLSSLSSSLLLPYGLHCATTEGQTRRQDEPNCTSSFFSCPATIASTTTGTRPSIPTPLPGMSSVVAPSVPIREGGYKGYPGFLAWQQLQHQAQQFQQFPTAPVNAIPSIHHQPANWSRISEIPGTPSRKRVSYRY